jgi:hypothetical protein
MTADSFKMPRLRPGGPLSLGWRQGLVNSWTPSGEALQLVLAKVERSMCMFMSMCADFTI